MVWFSSQIYSGVISAKWCPGRYEVLTCTAPFWMALLDPTCPMASIVRKPAVKIVDRQGTRAPDAGAHAHFA